MRSLKFDVVNTSIAFLLPTAIGIILLATLALFFNNSVIAQEGRLITHLSVALLSATAIVSFINAYRTESLRGKRLWIIIGTAFVYFALDDQFLIHERTDKAIHWLFEIQETPLTDELDGIIVFLYFIAALSVVIAFSKILRWQVGTILCIIIGFAFMLAMIVLDFMHTGFPFDNAFFEESCKVIAEYFFFLAFFLALPNQSSETSLATGQ